MGGDTSPSHTLPLWPASWPWVAMPQGDFARLCCNSFMVATIEHPLPLTKILATPLYGIEVNSSSINVIVTVAYCKCKHSECSDLDRYLNPIISYTMPSHFSVFVKDKCIIYMPETFASSPCEWCVLLAYGSYSTTAFRETGNLQFLKFIIKHGVVSVLQNSARYRIEQF